MSPEFLSDADSECATTVLEKLRSHGIHEWALTGGLAIEIHAALFGSPTATRPLILISSYPDSTA